MDSAEIVDRRLNKNKVSVRSSVIDLVNFHNMFLGSRKLNVKIM